MKKLISDMYEKNNYFRLSQHIKACQMNYITTHLELVSTIIIMMQLNLWGNKTMKNDT